MRYLITGGAGFLGSNLADKLSTDGERVTVFDNLSRAGSLDNLKWMKSRSSVNFVHGDIRSENDVNLVIMKERPDVVFHFCGQVAMTTSIANPRLDFETNCLGSINLLESIRKWSPESVAIYSSTNKVYGDLNHLTYKKTKTRYICNEFPDGFDESLKLEFHSPYGCSKGCADQYFLDYSRIYGLKTAVLRHSSMYGGRQFSTFDQGWIGWFVQRMLALKNNEIDCIEIAGDGYQVRDIMHATDMVEMYQKAALSIDGIVGEEFNVGGGKSNSFSLLELLEKLSEILSVNDYKIIHNPPRESDQKVFVSNSNKLFNKIDFKINVDKVSGLRSMVEWADSM